MAKRNKTPTTEVIKGQYHEAFCDVSYYHMWCVRRPNERKFGQGHHVHTKAEALALMNRLDDLERKKQKH